MIEGTFSIAPAEWANAKYNGNGSFSSSSIYICASYKIRGEIRDVTFDGSLSVLQHTWDTSLQKWVTSEATTQIYASCYCETYGYTRRANSSVSDGTSISINYYDVSRLIFQVNYINTSMFPLHPPDWEPPEGFTNNYWTLKDFPSITYTAYVWEMIDGEPRIEDMPDDAEYTLPMPKSQWRIQSGYNDGFPFNELMPNVPRTAGAFQGADKLNRIKIPISVKTIGPAAFKDTALQRVRIAADCTYGEQSFPAGCVVTRYPDDRYEQLYDCDGKAVLDYDGARVYVLKEDTNNG